MTLILSIAMTQHSPVTVHPHLTNTVIFAIKSSAIGTNARDILPRHTREVVIEGRSCFPCKLEHNGKSTKRAHYHCPHCDKTILIRNRFIKHVE